MGEGVKTNAGLDWAWPKFAVSQFRRSNAFGSMDGTGWTGILGQPGDFTNGTGTAEQDLVQLVYNGRERPGLAAFYTEYLPALQRLKQ